MDDGPLVGFVPKLAFVLVVWLPGRPVVGTVRLVASSRGRSRSADDPDHDDRARPEDAEQLSR